MYPCTPFFLTTSAYSKKQMYKDVEKYSVFRNKSNSYIKVLKKGVQIKNKDFKPHRYHVLPVPLLFKKKDT